MGSPPSGDGVLDGNPDLRSFRAAFGAPGVVRDRDVEDDLPDLHLRPVAGRWHTGCKTLRASFPARLGTVVRPDQLDLGLTRMRWAMAGSMLGSGSVVVMDSDTCPVRAAWRTPVLPPRIVRSVDAVQGRERLIEKIMHRLDRLWVAKGTSTSVLERL